MLSQTFSRLAISCFLTASLSFGLLFCPALPGRSDGAKKDPNKPSQMTNAQSGTPNLPAATSRVIDWTHMGAASQTSLGSATAKLNLALSLSNDLAPFLSAPPPTAAADLMIAPHAVSHAEQTAFQKLIQAAHDAELHDKKHKGYYSAAYVGTGVRAGREKPIYVLPELNYGYERYGVETGFAEFLGSDDNGHAQSGQGLSAKAEVTDRTARCVRILDRLSAALLNADQVSVFTQHTSHVNNPSSSAPQGSSPSDVDILYKTFDVDLLYETFITKKHPLLTHELGSLFIAYKPFAQFHTIKELSQALAAGEIKGTKENPIDPILLATLTDVAKNRSDLLNSYVQTVQQPAVSLLLGDRLVNRGGSLLDYGGSASTLLEFRQGQDKAGVTALGVVQRFEDRLDGDPRQSAARAGAALIYQNHAPYIDSDGNLGPTWNYKLGLEYTAPMLGLKETYAEFVRYRTLPSYFEITITAGKDGLRQDYVDVSIGHSWAF